MPRTAIYAATYTVSDKGIKFPTQVNKKVTAPRLEDIEGTIRRNLLRSGYTKWLNLQIHHKAFLGYKN